MKKATRFTRFVFAMSMLFAVFIGESWGQPNGGALQNAKMRLDSFKPDAQGRLSGICVVLNFTSDPTPITISNPPANIWSFHTSGITVTADGENVPLHPWGYNDVSTEVKVYVMEPIGWGAVVTVAYDNTMKDGGKNLGSTPSFTATSVTNNLTNTVLSATISGPDDNQLYEQAAIADRIITVKMKFSKIVTVTGTPRVTFRARKMSDNTTHNRIANYNSGGGTNTLTFRSTGNVPKGSGLVLLANTLVRHGGSTITANIGGTATNLPNLNHSPSINPAPIIIASESNVNGNTVTIAYDELLKTAKPPSPMDFTMIINGSSLNGDIGHGYKVSTVSISGRNVTLTLNKAVTSTDRVAVDYDHVVDDYSKIGRGAHLDAERAFLISVGRGPDDYEPIQDREGVWAAHFTDDDAFGFTNDTPKSAPSGQGYLRRSKPAIVQVDQYMQSGDNKPLGFKGFVLRNITPPEVKPPVQPPTPPVQPDPPTPLPVDPPAVNPTTLSMDLNLARGDQSVNSIEVAPNEIVPIQIFSTEPDEPVHRIYIDFEYDSSQIDHIEVAHSSYYLVPIATESDIKRVRVRSYHTHYSPGHLFTLNLRTTDQFSGATIRMVEARIQYVTHPVFVSLNTGIDLLLKPALTPDFDGNGIVNVADFVLFVSAFDSKLGDDRYDAKYDLNMDGEIGVPDFLIFMDAFGVTIN